MKKFMLVITIFSSLLLFTACQNSENESGDSSKKEITMMLTGNQEEQDAYEQVIKEFEKENDVKVKVIPTDGSQYKTKLQAAISGGNVPDVFWFEQVDFLTYVNNGVLLEMDDYLSDEAKNDIDGIWPMAVKNFQFDGTDVGAGTHYGLPKDAAPFALGYNKTMFEENGIELPDKSHSFTQEEFVTIAKKLTKDTNGDGELDQWGTGLDVRWSLPSFVWGNGGDWLNEDATKVTIDTPEFISALQEFVNLQIKYEVTPSVSQGQTLDTYQRWMKGELAFFPVGPWDMGTYQKLDFEYDLIPWPTGQSGDWATYFQSTGIGVSANTKSPEDAVELVKYLSTSVKGQDALVEASVQIPNNVEKAKEWASDTSSRPINKQIFLDILDTNGRSLPMTRTYTSEWYDEFFTNIQPVLDGKKTAEEYVKEAQPKMQKLLDKSISDQ